MKVMPAAGSRGNDGTERQAVAQLLDPRQRDPGLLLRAAHGRNVLTDEPVDRQRQLNESPQAHEPVAFGLSMVKPCFSMVSTKSMVAPCT